MTALLSTLRLAVACEGYGSEGWNRKILGGRSRSVAFAEAMGEARALGVDTTIVPRRGPVAERAEVLKDAIAVHLASQGSREVAYYAYAAARVLRRGASFAEAVEFAVWARSYIHARDYATHREPGWVLALWRESCEACERRLRFSNVTFECGGVRFDAMELRASGALQ